ncbi:MAG: exosortase C-terminal domain/associated protein EpsI [Candidatus Omnitrophota bacterium]
MKHKNYFISVIILALACIAIVKLESFNNAVQPAKAFKDFPMSIGRWQGKDIALSKQVYEILNTDDVVVREYEDSEGNSVLLAVVYSANDRASFHPPELCYLGGGLKLLDKRTEDVWLDKIRVLKTNTLTMQNKDFISKAWYWFAAGKSFTHNYYLQQVKILGNWLKYNSKEGALIRVSALLDKANPKAAEAKVKDFIRAITPFLEEFLEKT